MRAVVLSLLLSWSIATTAEVIAQPGQRIGAPRTAAQFATGAGIGIGLGLVGGFAAQKISSCANDCTDQLGIGYMSGAVIGTAIGVQLQGREASNRLTFIAAAAGSVVGAQLMIGIGEDFELGVLPTLGLAVLPAVSAVSAHALARAGIRRQWNVQVGQWRVDPPQLAVLPDLTGGGVAYQVRLSGIRF